MECSNCDKETPSVYMLCEECYTLLQNNVVQKYAELLYAVCRKFPGETRHETAIRYIQEAEQRATNPSIKAARKELR